MQFLSNILKKRSESDPLKELEEFLILELTLYPEKWEWGSANVLKHTSGNTAYKYGDAVSTGAYFKSKCAALVEAFDVSMDAVLDEQDKKQDMQRASTLKRTLWEFKAYRFKL